MPVLPLQPLVEHAVAMVEAQLHIHIDLRSAPGQLPVAADAGSLTQALVALFSLAAHSAGAGSVLEVRVQRHAAAARIAVAGIAPNAPGLGAVQAIIEQHRGTAGFNSKPGLPTDYYADLPLADGPRTA